MLKMLRTPRWLVATVVVVGVCLVFATLGQWQLRRHQERQLENQVTANRLSGERLDLQALLDATGGEIEGLSFRPVTVTGEFDPENELLVRSQVAAERPGFHVVTPLVTSFGTVLVNRGWVPLAAESPPVTEVPPPTGVVTIEGVVRESQVRPSIGPVEPPGRLSTVARIDLDRLSAQYPDLVSVWVQETGPTTEALPVRAALPATDDPGPHLPYAFQWFSFAAIAAIGYGLLIRRSLRGGI